MKKKHNKISVILLLTVALLFYYAAKSQEQTAFPASQSFHRWGSVTVFNGLSSDRVRAIAQTPDGVLWLGTEGGLSKFDGRRVQPVALGNGETNKIFALEISLNGTLWIGTDNGLFQFKGGQFHKIEGTENQVVTSILPGDSIFLTTENGQIWKLTETSGDVLNVEKIPAQPLFDNGGQLLKLTALAQAGDTVIAASRGRSILLIEGNQTYETFSRPRPFFANDLIADRQGKVWLGADADESASGLFSLENIGRPQRIGEGLGNVLAIEADKAGGIWAGTETRGLVHFTTNGEQRSHYTFENTAGGLRSNTIYSLFVDRENVIWVGTDRGVCRFDPASPLANRLSEGGNGNFIRALYKAEGGQVFAGTNRGLFTLSGDAWSEAENFQAKTVYALGETASEEILIGTPGGLFGLDGRLKIPGDFRAVANFRGITYGAVFGRGVVQIDNQAQVFDDGSTVTLFADAENLWIGTAAGGVFTFDGKGIKQPESLAGLRGGAIREITKDGANNLWIACDKGLFVFKDGQLENVVTGKIVQDVFINGADIWAATEGDGLVHIRRDEVFGWIKVGLSSEQGLPSQKIFSLLPIENHLLLGTNRGVVRYTPNMIPPKIITTRVLSQRLYEVSELSKTIELTYPQNSILVEAAGLSSRTFPEQFQYGFLLKNSKGEILDKKLSNDAQFAPENLPAGEYSIEAWAFNADLLTSEPLTIRFSVARAPFPRTATALGVLLGIALIALIWAIVERRRIGERNRELASARLNLANEAERERKRIAGDLHDQTLADLRNLMMMSDKLPADNTEFRREVESISTEIRRICEDLSPSVLENVGLVAALEFLLNHTSENSRFNAPAEDLEEKLKFSQNQQMQIYRIAQEVLTNIKHHSDAKSVEMTVNVTENENFILTVSDDGAAFTPPHKSAKGRGIVNIKSRAALIKAEIFWRESEEGGTLFQLKKKI